MKRIGRYRLLVMGTLLLLMVTTPSLAGGGQEVDPGPGDDPIDINPYHVYEAPMDDYYRCDPLPQFEVVLDGFAQGFAGGAENVDPGDVPAQGGLITITNTTSAQLDTRVVWDLNVHGDNRRYWVPVSVAVGASVTLEYTYLQPVTPLTVTACAATGTIGIIESPDPVVTVRPPPPPQTFDGGGKK